MPRPEPISRHILSNSAPSVPSRLLGIFGGTFDPVHIGHLRLAEEAREQLALAEVRWIPAGQPPHRAGTQVTGAHRLALVRAAVADNPAFSVDSAEVESAAPSYSVTTLERLRAQEGDRPLVLLLGADAFLGFTRWHRWRDIVELAHLAVLTRPGMHGELFDPARGGAGLGLHADAELADLIATRRLDPQERARLESRPSGGLVFLPMSPLAVSATDIRTRLREGRSVRYLLPPSVIDYIAANRLYCPE